MLKDPKPPMIPKETSLTTHPEASTKMYGINKMQRTDTKYFERNLTDVQIYVQTFLESTFSDDRQ